MHDIHDKESPKPTEIQNEESNNQEIVNTVDDEVEKLFAEMGYETENKVEPIPKESTIPITDKRDNDDDDNESSTKQAIRPWYSWLFGRKSKEEKNINDEVEKVINDEVENVINDVMITTDIESADKEQKPTKRESASAAWKHAIHGDEGDDVESSSSTSKRTKSEIAELHRGRTGRSKHHSITLNREKEYGHCAWCESKKKERKKNIRGVRGLMAWNMVLEIVDLVTDWIVIGTYLNSSKLWMYGLVLLGVLLVALMSHFKESYEWKHPWYTWFFMGGIYEAYMSLGLEDPRPGWDHFRFNHTTSEALPQMLAQIYIVIEVVGYGSYGDMIKEMGDGFFGYVSILSILISCGAISHILVIHASTLMTDGETFQIVHRWFLKCGSGLGTAARYVFVTVVFFFTDTLLRLCSMIVFLNAKPIFPYNWVVVGLQVPVYFYFEYFQSDSWFERITETFASMFSNESILDIIDFYGNNPMMRLPRWARVGRVVMEYCVFLAYILSSLIAAWDDIEDFSIFITLLVLFVVNFLALGGVFHFFAHRSSLFRKWELKISNDVSNGFCRCTPVHELAMNVLQFNTDEILGLEKGQLKNESEEKESVEQEKKEDP